MFLNGRPSYRLYFWEVADTHQVLQSLLQGLNNQSGASDASHAPITSISTATTVKSSRAQRCRQQQEEELDDQHNTMSLIPLVNSIKELAEECQRQMILERVEDRNHERHLEEQRQQSERNRERAFHRRAELLDLAHKQYRKLNAELHPNEENSRRLSEFYDEESCLLEVKIRQLDL